MDIKNMKVADLKLELQKRGLSYQGSKKQLMSRLKVDVDSNKIFEDSESDDSFGSCETVVDYGKQTRETRKSNNKGFFRLLNYIKALENKIAFLEKSFTKFKKSKTKKLEDSSNKTEAKDKKHQLHLENNNNQHRISKTTKNVNVKTSSSDSSDTMTALNLAPADNPENTSKNIVSFSDSSNLSEVNTIKSLIQTNNIGKLNNEEKPKLLVLSDSHGRGLQKFLNRMCSDYFDLQIFFKPNAKLDQIVADIENLTHCFSHKDFIIIIGGTNDKNHLNIEKTITKIANICFRTNVVISLVPYRYDTISANKNIYNGNQKICNAVKRLQKYNSNIGLFDINNEMAVSDYTKHGLHFSDSGKKKVCCNLWNYIRQWTKSYNDNCNLIDVLGLYSSPKVTISDDNFKKATDPELGHANTHVRRFLFRRRVLENQK